MAQPLDAEEIGSEPRQRRFPPLRWIVIGAVVLLAVLWLAPTVTAFVSDIDLAGLSHPYLIIFGFVVLDAVVPIFPSESLLTTASNLAAQSGSDLVLWRIILAGALGATVGDSLLYWLSRTFLRRSMSNRVEQAQQNPKAARALEVLSGNAPLLIVFGRFVPGLRFVVGATMGLARYSYPRFLLWDAIGGTLWATYTCVFSYLVASAIDDKPVLSIAISVVVTTALLALLYKPLKRSWDDTAAEPAIP
ncbi:MAG: DedA family protein, partial [Acidimicrobiia bacterium]|nr:DedA family protein [Acidimicrobiia bacterium]